MNCSICEYEKGVIRVSGGNICKYCYAKIPKVFKNNLSRFTLPQIKSIIDYSDWIDKSMFQPTASFGKLYVDEIHGLFAIIDKYKEGKEIRILDIFNCLNLTDVGLTATNVSVDRHNNVTCDYELSCWFNYPNASFKEIVRKNVKCPSKRKNSHELTYEYSGDYSMFLNIFNQMLETARKKQQESAEKILLSKYDLDLFKAENLFMLGEYYDEEEIQYKKDKLIKAYSGDDEAIKCIEHSAQILTSEITKRWGDL